MPSVFVGTGTARPNGREASVHKYDRRSHTYTDTITDIPPDNTPET